MTDQAVGFHALLGENQSQMGELGGDENAPPANPVQRTTLVSLLQAECKRLFRNGTFRCRRTAYCVESPRKRGLSRVQGSVFQG